MKVLQPESRLTFSETELDVYHINGERWLGGYQLVTPLGYSDPAGIKMLYRRNRDEFGEDETRVLTISTPGGPQQVRMFSLSGAELLAIHAKTPMGKEFRRYLRQLNSAVRDGRLVSATPSPALPHQGGGGAPVAMNAAMADALRAEILAARPVWAKIARYRSMGLSQKEAAKLLDMDRSRVREQVRRMEACGILQPPANLAAMQGNVVNFRRLPKPEGR